MSDVSTLEQENVQLKKALRDTAEELKRSEAEVAALSPTVDIRRFIWEDAEDVIEFFGEERLRHIAEGTLKEMNRDRIRNGYGAITYTDDEWAAAVDEAVQDLLMDTTLGPPDEGPLARTLKMLKPDGNLVQIPYEGQINNIAGSLEDGYRRYTKKMFKRGEPMLCPSMDCWKPAEVVGSGKDKGSFAFEGYCSADHLNRTERRNAAGVPGVTSRNEIIGRPQTSG